MKVFFSPRKANVDKGAIPKNTIVKVVFGHDDNVCSAKMYTALSVTDHGGHPDYVAIEIKNECHDTKIDHMDIVPSSGVNFSGEGDYYRCDWNYIWSIER
ncbi:TPA: hypothetical protein SMF60_001127 [Serratia marcescens]|nr:hypothetical protein [Serratia marcescens]